MSLVDQILGKQPVGRGPVDESDVPPVLAGKRNDPRRQRTVPPKDKDDDKLRQKARQSSVVASIIGMTEADDESIIPPDAQSMDNMTGAANIPGIRTDPLPPADGPAEPQATTNVAGEELIQPTAALVAPDVTPNVFQQLDPSQVPAPPKPAERPMPPPSVAAAQQMGREQPMTQPSTSSSASARGVMDTILGRQNPAPEELQAMAESMVATMADPAEIAAKVANAMTPAQPGASLMPEHKEGDGKTVYNSFRRFMG
jgi:hypothetical protein